MPSKANQPKAAQRIPFMAFRDEVMSLGIVGDENIGDFVRELQQAAADGVIQFWGRTPPRLAGRAGQMPVLSEIPRSHWFDHHIPKISWDATVGEQVWTASNVKDGQIVEDCYEDLHLDAAQARAWIKART